MPTDIKPDTIIPKLLTASEIEIKSTIETLKHALGADILDALDDPQTSDLMINPDGKMWLEHSGKPLSYMGQKDMTQIEGAISIIASMVGKEVGSRNPTLDAVLPESMGCHRIAAQVFPVVPPNTASLVLRRRADQIFTMEQYLEWGVINNKQYNCLVDAVQSYRNIMVAGATGCGKTTMANAVLHKTAHLCPEDRVLIIEDTPELQCAVPNRLHWLTATVLKKNKDGQEYVDKITYRDLLIHALRNCPTRIFLGETRGDELLTLLEGWMSHPGGISTVHAETVEKALQRMETMLGQGSDNLSEESKRHDIGDNVSCLVSLVKLKATTERPAVRIAREIVKIGGYDKAKGEYIITQRLQHERYNELTRDNFLIREYGDVPQFDGFNVH